MRRFEGPSNVLGLRPSRHFPVDPAKDYTLFAGFIHLGAGLACGFTGLAAGYAIGIVGDTVRLFDSLELVGIELSNAPWAAFLLLSFLLQCVRAYVYESRVFVSMVLILIFAEVLGLYG